MPRSLDLRKAIKQEHSQMLIFEHGIGRSADAQLSPECQIKVDIASSVLATILDPRHSPICLLAVNHIGLWRRVATAKDTEYLAPPMCVGSGENMMPGGRDPEQKESSYIWTNASSEQLRQSILVPFSQQMVCSQACKQSSSH